MISKVKFISNKTQEEMQTRSEKSSFLLGIGDNTLDGFGGARGISGVARTTESSGVISGICSLKVSREKNPIDVKQRQSLTSTISATLLFPN